MMALDQGSHLERKRNVSWNIADYERT